LKTSARKKNFTPTQMSQKPPVVWNSLSDKDKKRIDRVCRVFHLHQNWKRVNDSEPKVKLLILDYDIDVRATLEPIIHKLQRIIERSESGFSRVEHTDLPSSDPPSHTQQP
jgi:hypothetical protein